jgi:hypothetical protein
VAALRPGPGVRVKARVKDLSGWELPETPWVEITEYADLLFKLIQPPVRSKMTVTDLPILCEVRIQHDDEELALNIMLAGKGKVLFSQSGLRFGLIRDRPCYPLEPEIDSKGAIYTSESLAITYFVLALSQKDHALQKRMATQLRTSLGLPTDSPPR